jgi:hypothetical protein
VALAQLPGATGGHGGGAVLKQKCPERWIIAPGSFFSFGLAYEHVICLQALGSVCNDKLYGLAFLQTTESV